MHPQLLRVRAFLSDKPGGWVGVALRGRVRPVLAGAGTRARRGLGGFKSSSRLCVCACASARACACASVRVRVRVRRARTRTRTHTRTRHCVCVLGWQATASGGQSARARAAPVDSDPLPRPRPCSTWKLGPKTAATATRKCKRRAAEVHAISGEGRWPRPASEASAGSGPAVSVTVAPA